MPRAKKSPASVTTSNVTSISDAPHGDAVMSGRAIEGLEEHIRRRAYELYQQRGGEHGSDLEDWLRAEAEVRALTGKRSA
jgi:DUF2934 family protein